jgi:serine protease Do
VSEDVKGVLVTGVTADSGAAEKGLRPGDIIVEINQEEVSSPGQIASKVSEAMDNDRRSVLLLVNRNGDLRFVAVRVDSG